LALGHCQKVNLLPTNHKTESVAWLSSGKVPVTFGLLRVVCQQKWKNLTKGQQNVLSFLTPWPEGQKEGHEKAYIWIICRQALLESQNSVVVVNNWLKVTIVSKVFKKKHSGIDHVLYVTDLKAIMTLEEREKA
jgi:hypothetical protein